MASKNKTVKAAVEMVDIVDKDDKVIGTMSEDEAMKGKGRFRIAHVILRNMDGDMLVQWRKADKTLSPRMFTASAAGKVSADQVRQALTSGPMRQQAQGLNADEINQLVVFVTYKTVASWAEPDPRANRCKGPPSLDAEASDWTGWGRDPENTRFQPAPGIAAADRSAI